MTTPVGPLSPEDNALIQAFADHIGTTPHHLVLMASKALAEHLRANGTLTFPLQIGLPSPHCLHCPLSKSADHALPAPQNVIQGRW